MVRAALFRSFEWTLKIKPNLFAKIFKGVANLTNKPTVGIRGTQALIGWRTARAMCERVCELRRDVKNFFQTLHNLLWSRHGENLRPKTKAELLERRVGRGGHCCGNERIVREPGSPDVQHADQDVAWQRYWEARWADRKKDCVDIWRREIHSPRIHVLRRKRLAVWSPRSRMPGGGVLYEARHSDAVDEYSRDRIHSRLRKAPLRHTEQTETTAPYRGKSNFHECWCSFFFFW